MTLTVILFLVCIFSIYLLIDGRPQPPLENPTNTILGECFVYRQVPSDGTYLLSEPIALSSDLPDSLKYSLNYMKVMRKERTPTGITLLAQCPHQPQGNPSTYIIQMNDLYLSINDNKNSFFLRTTLSNGSILNMEKYQPTGQQWPLVRIRWNTHVLSAKLDVIPANTVDSNRSDFQFYLKDGQFVPIDNPNVILTQDGDQLVLRTTTLLPEIHLIGI